MEIHFPPKFHEALKRDEKLFGAVTLTVSEFEPWLRLSGTPLFPEYTDHGPNHITEVMATSSAIIRQETWEAMTPRDVATLILAILLHDCAMHLSEDGFATLVSGKTKKPLIEGLGDAPWPGLWVDFLGEASRFDA